MALTILAVLSGALQALGYILYVRIAVTNGNVPNPISWLMFGYGTTLLFFLEVDQGAGWQLIVLPAVCAISSLSVVYLCWKRGGFKNPIDLPNSVAFGFDILLTICYLTAWVLMSRGIISEDQRETASLVILICWNIGIFTAFVPIMREVRDYPEHEHFLPWVVWTLAYVALFATTLVKNGSAHPELLLYPLLNSLAHGYMAWVAKFGKGRAELPVRPL